MSNVPNNNPSTPDTTAVNTATGKLALGWALVGVPLAYGVYETLTRVAALFD
ncbi:hypothetical protein SAMN04489743_1369 [Pseudarthrobacter equi]|uniref:Uncharacterized protein n=1 Tax=Pseudarthrobacter equi TaxID=728066 RepID=A0A1H1WLX5_9MICC|nr:hypothetical protein [Pseudarthrobacter equi]SDS98054.1 hypothetical protein SAMN04489743_1369 [Pseudarthrobacter equi]